MDVSGWEGEQRERERRGEGGGGREGEERGRKEGRGGGGREGEERGEEGAGGKGIRSTAVVAILNLLSMLQDIAQHEYIRTILLQKRKMRGCVQR